MQITTFQINIDNYIWFIKVFESSLTSKAFLSRYYKFTSYVIKRRQKKDTSKFIFIRKLGFQLVSFLSFKYVLEFGFYYENRTEFPLFLE
ncbi:hypothetical protein HanIR_Chr07g0310251 [Helianthus annuus]|nr:hypothetical protein HanIR_Chr07g0310251 [Helianthus annuus]